MLKGTSSKLNKMLSKSSSKDHVFLSSSDGALPSPDAQIPQKKDINLARQPRGSSRGSVRRRCESKGKSTEVKEAAGEVADVVKTNDDDSKEVIQDYHDNPLDVLEVMFER